MNINFARLNHILIPTRKEGRDRFRKSFAGRLVRPLLFPFAALSSEGRLFAFASLLAAAFGFEVRVTDAYILWAALAGLLTASVALTWLFKLEGVRLEVTVPRRVTVGEEVAFTIVAKNDGERGYHTLRFGGPFLPWDGRWTAAPPSAMSLPAHGEAKVQMRARFVERGEHHLDPFHAGALVPLGLTIGPRLSSAGCRFLVVPRIANVVRVTTPRGQRHQPGGVALASKTGESMDLLGVRPYRPGDPVRDLHARTWARIGTPVVREYQQEYFSRVGVILDTDRQAAADEKRLEAAISLAAGVVARLSRGEALIDLLVVGGNVHTLTLGRSLGGFDQALDLLACVERGAPFDPEGLLERLSPHLPQLSCVVFVALAWDEPRERFIDRVRARGIGCSSLLVVRDERATAPSATVLAVSAQAIERGEALRL